MTEIINPKNDEEENIISIDKKIEREDFLKTKERAEKYEKAQIERINHFTVGAADYAGNIITRVYSRFDEFVIYEIQDVPTHESLRIFIQSIDEYDDSKIILFQQCKPHFDEFTANCYRYNCASIYRKRAATVLSSIILGILDPTEDNFKKINDDIKLDYNNMMLGRNYYQLGAITFSIITIILSAIIYLSRTTDFIKENHFIPVIVYAAAFASMGGFISVSLKIKSLHTDRELRSSNYFLYGAERILFSIIAGILIYFMLKGNIIFGFLNSSGDISFSIYVICALSGFSETLIPNTLRNLETKSEK